MYVITAHQRHGRTDRRTDVKRSHDRYIAKACSGNKTSSFNERSHTWTQSTLVDSSNTLTQPIIVNNVFTSVGKQ